MQVYKVTFDTNRFVKERGDLCVVTASGLGGVQIFKSVFDGSVLIDIFLLSHFKYIAVAVIVYGKGKLGVKF